MQMCCNAGLRASAHFYAAQLRDISEPTTDLLPGDGPSPTSYSRQGIYN